MSEISALLIADTGTLLMLHADIDMVVLNMNLDYRPALYVTTNVCFVPVYYTLLLIVLIQWLSQLI